MASEKKNLSYFMRANEPEIVKVPGPDTIKDENGNPVMLEIKVLSQGDIQRINKNYKTRTMATDKRGNPLIANGEVVWKTEDDMARASRHIIVEALIYPNLKDPELMQYYGCVDVTDMPLKVFPRTDEYLHVSRAVMAALGLSSDDIEIEKDEKEAKN